MEVVNRVLLEDKIYEMFEEAFNKMEQKFNKDYEELRNLSVLFTDMYHDVNDNIIPLLNFVEENSSLLNSNAKENKKEENLSNLNERSKTPVKSFVNTNKSNNNMNMNRMQNDEFKIQNKRENDLTPTKIDRSKTPVMIKNKNLTNGNISSNKKEIESNNTNAQIMGSILNVTIKDKEKDEKKSNEVDGISSNPNTNTNFHSREGGRNNLNKEVGSSKNVKDAVNKIVTREKYNNKKEENNIIQEKENEIANNSKTKNSKSRLPNPTSNLKTRDFTPVATNKKIQKILDVSEEFPKNENSSIQNNANIRRKPSNNIRNNTKRITGTNTSKIENNLTPAKTKRNTAIEIPQIPSLQSKKIIKNLENSGRIDSDDEKKDEISKNIVKNEIKPVKVIEIPKKKKEIEFTQKSVECMSIFANSNFIDEKLKVSLTISIKEIYEKIGLKNILERKIKIVQHEIVKREEVIDIYLQNPANEIILNKKFTPSKTAQNGLNFVTKEEENNLSKSKQTSNEILNIFKLIYIIINEKYEEENTNIIQHLTIHVFKKLGVENLSNYLIHILIIESLFLNYITPNLKFSQEQYEAMSELIKENPNLLSPTDLLRMNRCLSYMSFFLKEIFDFCSAKLSDGTPAFKIRSLKYELNVLRERLFLMRKVQCLM